MPRKNALSSVHLYLDEKLQTRYNICIEESRSKTISFLEAGKRYGDIWKALQEPASNPSLAFFPQFTNRISSFTRAGKEQLTDWSKPAWPQDSFWPNGKGPCPFAQRTVRNWSRHRVTSCSRRGRGGWRLWADYWQSDCQRRDTGRIPMCWSHLFEGRTLF